MPKAWSGKDERQYEAIKTQQTKRGRSEDRAEEIAARTVNKRRREEGRTSNTRTAGTGNPHARLEQRSKDELYNRAQQLNIRGRDSMSKDELIAAIRKRN